MGEQLEEASDEKEKTATDTAKDTTEGTTEGCPSKEAARTWLLVIKASRRDTAVVVEGFTEASCGEARKALGMLSGGTCINRP